MLNLSPFDAQVNDESCEGYVRGQRQQQECHHHVHQSFARPESIIRLLMQVWHFQRLTPLFIRTSFTACTSLHCWQVGIADIGIGALRFIFLRVSHPLTAPDP